MQYTPLIIRGRYIYMTDDASHWNYLNTFHNDYIDVLHSNRLRSSNIYIQRTYEYLKTGTIKHILFLCGDIINSLLLAITCVCLKPPATA